MSALKAKISALNRDLDLLLAGDENRRIIDEVERATEELAAVAAPLEHATACRVILIGNPVGCSSYEFIVQEAPLYARVFAKFQALKRAWQEDPAAVRQSGAVGDFCESVREYVGVIDSNSVASWTTWRDGLERTFSIASVQLDSIKNVLNYAVPIARYRQGIIRFANLTRVVPTTPSDLQKIVAEASALATIKEELVFDLPPKVVAFFDALDRDGQVALGTLDPEVRVWLTEHDGVKDLVIVRRRTL